MHHDRRRHRAVRRFGNAMGTAEDGRFPNHPTTDRPMIPTTSTGTIYCPNIRKRNGSGHRGSYLPTASQQLVFDMKNAEVYQGIV